MIIDLTCKMKAFLPLPTGLVTEVDVGDVVSAALVHVWSSPRFSEATMPTHHSWQAGKTPKEGRV